MNLRHCVLAVCNVPNASYHTRHTIALLQVDSVLSRLTALKERIEGTEALIEIDLDHRRNELVAFDLVRSACLLFI
jgi:hypothetical protein